MRLELAGDVTSALAHLAGVGAALILEENGAKSVRFWWENGPVARLNLEWSGVTDLGVAVHSHAARHSGSGDWVQLIVTHEGSTVGLFSPRVKSATSHESWTRFEALRDEVLDSSDLSWLDRRMIGSLGEPAFWLCTPKDNQPDRGASRWEMKTRNRGEDFVANRLALLAKSVASRAPDQVLVGLTGELVADEVGGHSGTSRTPTGLTVPRTTDNAIAWCALWGLAATTLIPQANEMSQASGSYPRQWVHPKRMALPVVVMPTTPSKWIRLLGSRKFDLASFNDDPQAKQSCAAVGITAIVRFPVDVRGSASAPERVLLAGTLDGLT